MSEQPPRWHYISDALVKWLALVGGVVAFLIITRPAATVDLVSRTIDAHVKQETEPIEIRLKQLEERIKTSAAMTADLEAKKASMPQLVVKPVIEETAPHMDIRGLRFEMHFTNVGLVDVSLRSMEVEVYKGRMCQASREVLDRTYRIAECLDVINSPPLSNEPNEIKERREQALKEFNELHAKCPHERLFLISEQSKDVRWERDDELHETRKTDIVLRPQQSAAEHFEYLLTESLNLHAGWLRLVVTVNGKEDTRQKFSIVVPTRHAPVFAEGSAFKTMYTRTKNQPENTGYRWAPESPLIPMKIEKDLPRIPMPR